MSRLDPSVFLIACCLLLFCAVPATAQTLTFVGASSGDATITVTQPTADLEYLFWLENPGTSKVEDVRVQVSDFVGPNNTRVAPTLNGKAPPAATVRFDALNDQFFIVAASFPAPGTYTARITWTDGKTRASRALKVERIVRKLPLDFSSHTTASTINGPFVEPTFTIALTDTGGRALDLYRPTLVLMSRKVTDKTVQAGFDQLEVRTDADEVLPEGETFNLPQRGTTSLRLVVPGLEAGEYTGQLQVSAPDAGLLREPFTLYVRNPWWWAMLLIGLGVYASYSVRRYLQNTVPRYHQRRRTLVLRADLISLEKNIPDLETAERHVLATLLGYLDTLYDRTGTRSLSLETGGEQLDDLDARLDLVPTWIELRRQVADVQTPDMRKDFEKELKTAETHLLDNPGKGVATKAKTLLDKLDTALPATIEKEVTDELDALIVELEAQRAATPTQDSVTRTELVALKDLVKGAKADAKGHEFALARTKYEDARRRYARVLAASLTATLEGDRAFNFDENSWKELVQKVNQALAAVPLAPDADGALRAFQEAYRLYIAGLARPARVYAQGLEKKIVEQSAEGSIDESKKKTFLKTLNEARGTLDEAIRQVEERQIREAAKSYNDAVARLTKLAADLGLKGQGIQQGVISKMLGLTNAGGLLPGGLHTPGERLVLQRVQRKLPTVQELDQEAKRREQIFAFVMFLVSVFLGLYVLYFDNLAWGTLKDYFVAVLWGLGLHQVTAQTAFGGLTALRAQYAAPPATP